MTSPTSTPVYISNDIIDGLQKYLSTPKGQSTGIKKPNKLIPYVLTKFLIDGADSSSN